MDTKDMVQFFKLAKAECSNHTETGPGKIKNYCSYERGGTHRCLLASGNPCSWFVEAVLPLKPDLQAKWEELFPKESSQARQTIFRQCDCGKHFKPKSNRQRMCPECSQENRKMLNRENRRKARAKRGRRVIF